MLPEKLECEVVDPHLETSLVYPHNSEGHWTAHRVEEQNSAPVDETEPYLGHVIDFASEAAAVQMGLAQGKLDDVLVGQAPYLGAAESGILPVHEGGLVAVELWAH
ncbi:hypothetical protein Dimus_009199 [Dionaea muscipula]